MGVPLPIIIMIAMMMLMFGVSVIVILKKKGDFFTQTIDAKPEQTNTHHKDGQAWNIPLYGSFSFTENSSHLWRHQRAVSIQHAPPTD